MALTAIGGAFAVLNALFDHYSLFSSSRLQYLCSIRAEDFPDTR